MNIHMYFRPKHFLISEPGENVANFTISVFKELCAVSFVWFELS